jgi:hypothetical protein
MFEEARPGSWLMVFMIYAMQSGDTHNTHTLTLTGYSKCNSLMLAHLPSLLLFQT